MAGLFSHDVATHVASAHDELDALFESEREYVARAVAKRRREFQAGRHCARRALRALGAPAVAIPSGSDRAPCWPAGYAGSITHTGGLDDGFAAAAVVRTDRVRSIGLDAERSEPLSEELFPRVLTQPEQSFLSGLPALERGPVAKLFFSAKEAFYKCQYPVTRQFLGFLEVELELELARGVFRAVLLRPAAGLAQGASFEGRFHLDDEHVLSGLEIPV